MVRPNQVISSNLDQNELTFIMFAQSEQQVKRRVLFLNFPSVIIPVMLGDAEIDDFIAQIQLVTEGMVNRWAVTIDAGVVNNVR